MAAYSLEALLQRWALHQLTSEQAIGQILLILQHVEERLLSLEKSAAAQQPTLSAVTPALALPTPPRAPRKRPSQGKAR